MTHSPPLAAAAPTAHVRLTVVSPGRPDAAADVLVEAPAGTCVGALLDDLARATTDAAAQPLCVDGRLLPDTSVVGRPPLLDGAVVVAGGLPRTPPDAPLLELHVVAGPAAGERFALGPGAHALGRGPDAAIRVDDADVSRVHAAVSVAAGAVRVSDLGSTNGTTLDRGGPWRGQDDGDPQPVPDDGGSGGVTRLVPGEDVGWPVGAVLVVGGSRLALRRPGDDAGTAPAATAQDGVGHLLVNRAPRVRPARARRRVELPVPPPTARHGRLPWPALVLPAVLAVPMALWWRQPAFLLLAVLSPVAMLGQHLFERRGARRADRRAAAEHAGAVARARADLACAVEADRRDLEEEHPDLAVVAVAAAGPSRRLWERSGSDTDALVLRVGLGAVPARVEVTGPAAVEVVHASGPVTLDVARAGVVGLAGPRAGALALARALVGQVCTLHTPREVHTVVLAADAQRRRDWSWARWLPHGPAAAGEGIDAPAAADLLGRADGTAGPGPREEATWTLVVLDGAHRLRADPAVAGVLDRARRAADDATGRSTVAGGPAPSAAGPTRARCVVLCLDDEETRLPAECAATVVLERRPDEGAGSLTTARVRVEGRPDQRCIPDGAGAAWAARLARDLARLRDATPRPADSGLPGTVRLADVAGLTTDDVERCAADLLTRWRRAPGTPPPLRAALGATAAGPWVVDLRRDGPHALVAGTTGSGKSELLRTLVASLAVEHPPHELNVLLVDYKGGTAFAGLAGLPHVCGLLTDLDAHLARRALTSLNAELRRRERLLRAAGVGDLDAYDRLAPAAPVPRLVVVVDEFRVLAEELPELLDGLVRIAALGRSLGVHLVLATQRPAGVVSADMRANLNLRLALRVRDRADSDDVVEAPDAARLPADRPGRALVRVGGGPLLPVQTALLSGGPARAPARPRVRRLPGPDAAPGGPVVEPVGPARPCAVDEWAGHPLGDTTTDLLGAACRNAAVVAGSPSAAPPWLPPLPGVVLLADVPRPAAGSADDEPRDHRPPRLTLGLADVPARQRREPLEWDFRDGHLGVAGAPGSGRTGVLRAVLAGVAQLDGAIHVHVLDGSGGPAVPAELPGLGTVVPASDPERAARLLRHLARVRLPAAWTVLVVDGWEAVLGALSGHDRGRPVDDLLTLARDRGSDGVRVAVAGGRGLLTGPLGPLLTTRLLLRTADPTDLLVAGLSAQDVPTVMPPGRAVQLCGSSDGPTHAQAGLLCADPSATAQDAALARLVGHGRPARAGSGPGDPLRLVPLPTRLGLESLRAAVAGGRDVRGQAAGAPAPGGPDAVAVGLGGDDAAPVWLPLPRGEVVLVAGGPSSGKSTALAVIGAQAAAAGRRPVRADPEARRQTADGDAGSVVVLADDVDRLPAAVQDDVAALVAAGATAVVSATAAEAAVAFRGLLAAARQCRCGLLLGPLAPGEGEALGVQESGPRHAPPGRGLLVVRGRSVAVQVADGRDPDRSDQRTRPALGRVR